MIDIKIKFEDKNVLVLDKPAGLVVTNEGKNNKFSLETYLKNKYGWAKNVDRSGLVHRLDKNTSGLLLVAKNEKYLQFLKKQFKDRLVYKEYVALADGDVSFCGEIKAPLIKNNRGVYGRRQVGIGGKDAWTEFKLIKKYVFEGKKYSLIKVVLKTGRTHQIRVHFNYLGWPLVGDRLYRGSGGLLTRPFLHAKKIELEYPEGKKFVAVSDMRDDLKNVLDKFMPI